MNEVDYKNDRRRKENYIGKEYFKEEFMKAVFLSLY